MHDLKIYAFSMLFEFVQQTSSIDDHAVISLCRIKRMNKDSTAKGALYV